MGKKLTSVNIDEDILIKAKQAGITLSDALEKGIKERIGTHDIRAELGILDELRCSDCGNKGVKETIETLNKDPSALSWLSPEEIWICNRCLNIRIGKIGVRQ